MSTLPHMFLKRLAVGEVCSEHELLERNVSDSEVATWFDAVVDNEVSDYHDANLPPDVDFVVCEMYDHTPLYIALGNAYDFACVVYRASRDIK